MTRQPAEDRICTSHVELANWSFRSHLRRMTRLSNGFSEKRSNLRVALALFFAYYSLVKGPFGFGYEAEVTWRP